MNSANIGLLIVCTGKYTGFAENLIESADKFFFPESENITYYLFTDNYDFYKKISGTKTTRPVVFMETRHKKWPWMTLGRYHFFSSNKELLSQEDYLFYSDADMLFCDTVGSEILSDRVATIHPGFSGGRGTPETNPKSKAYVSPSEGLTYFAGGFNGGLSSEYLKMSEVLSARINQDYENEIIAVWHDESHMNRYFIDNPPTKVLNTEYCTPSNLINTNTKLSAIVKDHASYR